MWGMGRITLPHLRSGSGAFRWSERRTEGEVGPPSRRRCYKKEVGPRGPVGSPGRDQRVEGRRGRPLGGVSSGLRGTGTAKGCRRWRPACRGKRPDPDPDPAPWEGLRRRRSA